MLICFFSLRDVPKSHLNARRRNDSDIQLDGVLLEGGSLTSPEGSSWSLSSCSSSSSKSIDNPPVYFNVESESWDDSLGAKHLRKRKNSQGIDTPIAHNHDETYGCPVKSNGSVDLGSFIHDPVSSIQPSQCSSNSRPNTSSQHVKVTTPTNAKAGMNGNHSSEVKQCQGRTSPVAVPRSSHNRHESSSSASIGRYIINPHVFRSFRVSYHSLLYLMLCIKVYHDNSFRLQLAIYYWNRQLKRNNFI